MRKQKKWISVVLLTSTIMLTIAFGGCGKKIGKNTYVVTPVDGENFNASCDLFARTLEGDQGIYYRGYRGRFGPMDYHYYDYESGKSVYLCSKPECMHDGNELCVATNENYLVGDDIFYDGKIYCSAYITGGLKFVLLRIEPDGSALTEVATLKESIGTPTGFECGEIFIHRGYVFASYGYRTEDKLCEGTVVYNLLDGTLSELPEYEYKVSLEGIYTDAPIVRSNFKAAGNYVYFNELRPIKERKNKRYLCRYDLSLGEIKDVPIDVMYQGTYCVTEPDNVVYTDKFNHLYKYDFASDETTPCSDLYAPIVNREENGEYVLNYDQDIIASIGDFLYYNGDLYAVLAAYFYDVSYYQSDYENVKGYPFLAKLNDKLEMEGEFIESPFTDKKLQENIGTDEYASPVKYSVLGDDLYIEFLNKSIMIVISLPKLLTGNVEYKILEYKE